MKRLLIGLAVLMLMAASIFLLLDRSLDDIVRQVVEHYGSELTGVKVEVASVDLVLGSGGATLRGIRVGNPEGFSPRHAFRLEEIAVTIDVSSLAQTPLVLNEVRIDGPEANLEFNESGESNLNRIQRNLAKKGAEGIESTAEGEPMRLRIRKLLLQEGKVRADATALVGRAMDLDLPPLQLKELGGADGGTPEEIGRTVLTALADAAVQTVRSQLKAEAAKAVQDRIDKAKNRLMKPRK